MKIVEVVVMLWTVSMLMVLVSLVVFLDTEIITAKHVCAFEQLRSDISFISKIVLESWKKNCYVTKRVILKQTLLISFKMQLELCINMYLLSSK